MFALEMYFLVALAFYILSVVLDQYCFDLHAEDPDKTADDMVSFSAAVAMVLSLIWPLTLVVVVILGACMLGVFVGKEYLPYIPAMIHLFIARMIIRIVNATVAIYKWMTGKYGDWKNAQPVVHVPEPAGDHSAAIEISPGGAM